MIERVYRSVETRSLSEVTAKAAKRKGKDYSTNRKTTLSASCAKAKHTHCFNLGCPCPCHGRKL